MTAVMKYFGKTPGPRFPLISFTMTYRRMSTFLITILVGIGSTAE